MTDAEQSYRMDLAAGIKEQDTLRNKNHQLVIT